MGVVRGHVHVLQELMMDGGHHAYVLQELMGGSCGSSLSHFCSLHYADHERLILINLIAI